VDELYVANRVRHLQATGIPAIEGYYLVVLSPSEAQELTAHLVARREKPKRRYKHPPIALTESAGLQGLDVRCVIGDALVVSVDHATTGLRCSQQPKSLSR
jgi:hypothetical protein